MEKKNMKKIKAGAAIFAVLAIAVLFSAGSTIVAGPAPPGPGPYHDAITVTLSATDGQSGVNFTKYRYLDVLSDDITPGFQMYTGPFQIIGVGTYTIEYYSVDNAGNQEAVKSTTITIVPFDSTPPVTEILVEDII